MTTYASFGDVTRTADEVRQILQDATRALHNGDASVTWVRVSVSDSPDTYKITFGGKDEQGTLGFIDKSGRDHTLVHGGVSMLLRKLDTNIPRPGETWYVKAHGRIVETSGRPPTAYDRDVITFGGRDDA